MMKAKYEYIHSNLKNKRSTKKNKKNKKKGNIFR